MITRLSREFTCLPGGGGRKRGYLEIEQAGLPIGDLADSISILLVRFFISNMTSMKKRIDIKVLDQFILKTLLSYNPTTGKFMFVETNNRRGHHVFFSERGTFLPHITNEKDRANRFWGSEWSIESMGRGLASLAIKDKIDLHNGDLIKIPSSWLLTRIDSLSSPERTIIEGDYESDPNYDIFSDQLLWDTVSYAAYLENPIPIGFIREHNGRMIFLIKNEGALFSWDYESLIEFAKKNGEKLTLTKYLSTNSKVQEGEK